MHCPNWRSEPRPPYRTYDPGARNTIIIMSINCACVVYIVLRKHHLYRERDLDIETHLAMALVLIFIQHLIIITITSALLHDTKQQVECDQK